MTDEIKGGKGKQRPQNFGDGDDGGTGGKTGARSYSEKVTTRAKEDGGGTGQKTGKRNDIGER